MIFAFEAVLDHFGELPYHGRKQLADLGTVESDEIMCRHRIKSLIDGLDDEFETTTPQHNDGHASGPLAEGLRTVAEEFDRIATVDELIDHHWFEKLYWFDKIPLLYVAGRDDEAWAAVEAAAAFFHDREGLNDVGHYVTKFKLDRLTDRV